MFPSRGRRPRRKTAEPDGRKQHMGCLSPDRSPLLADREALVAAARPQPALQVLTAASSGLVALLSGESDAKRQRRNVEEPPVDPDIERNRQVITNGSVSEHLRLVSYLVKRRSGGRALCNSLPPI